MKQELEFKSAGGHLHRGWQWTVAVPVARVVLITGMMETAARYDSFATYLNSLGCSVYCLDHFGQGRNCETSAELGVWPENGFQRSIDIFAQFINQLRIDKLPLYLFAHSMGSYITQGFIQQHGDIVDRVVLCGSSGKRRIAPLAAGIAGFRAKVHPRDSFRDKFMNQLMFGSYCRHIPNARTEFDWLSVNTANVDAYNADPNCGFIGTSGFYAEFLKGLASLCRPENLQHIPTALPLLLISGMEDPSTEYARGTKKLARMYERYHLNVHCKLYHGLRHELLNESDPQPIYKDIVRFFQLI